MMLSLIFFLSCPCIKSRYHLPGLKLLRVVTAIFLYLLEAPMELALKKATFDMFRTMTVKN